MATNKKSTPRYDLKAQDRKRDLAIKVGLTAINEVLIPRIFRAVFS